MTLQVVLDNIRNAINNGSVPKLNSQWRRYRVKFGILGHCRHEKLREEQRDEQHKHKVHLLGELKA